MVKQVFVLCMFLLITGFFQQSKSSSYITNQYIIEVDSYCLEGDISCSNLLITVIDKEKCELFKTEGISWNNPRTFNFYGYKFEYNSLKYLLYLRGEFLLTITDSQGNVTTEKVKEVNRIDIDQYETCLNSHYEVKK